MREEVTGTFTVAVRSWRFASNDVETTVDPSNEKWILLEYPLTDDPEEKHVHAIPLSGVAFRMEMLGLSDLNEALDITIKELNVPEENDVKGIYPKAVETYYDSSMKIARALLEEARVPSFRAMGFSPDDFVGSVRELLRGGSPPIALRPTGESPLGEAVSSLAASRNSTVSSLRAAQATVMIEETGSMRDLRSTVGNLTEEITRMTDEHAYRAMETGAYYYARIMERKGS